MDRICPKEVRYIKLGSAGIWEQRALERGEIYFGMPNEPTSLIDKADWAAVANHYKELGYGKGMAGYIARENREFSTFGSDCLWITFARRFLWWGFAEPGVTYIGGDGKAHGTRMRRIIGGWRNKDIKGSPLTRDRLSTKLTTVAAYRHTMCAVRHGDYLIRKINGEEEALVARAAKVRRDMIEVASEAIALLHPKDFEDLIDLVLARGGWERVSRVGGTQKDLDLELEHPTTQERAFVQVKSQASQATLEDYVARFDAGPWQRMIFALHTPVGKLRAPNRGNVHVWTGDALAAAVVRAGLYDWVVQKVA